MTTRERNLLKIGELLPEKQYACIAWMDECESNGFPIKISESYRSQEKQNDLYKIGRRGIAGERIVTQTLHSEHTRMLAVDVYSAIGESTPYFYATITSIAKKYGITHPFTSAPLVDLPHFSMASVPNKVVTAKKIDHNSLERAVERLENSGTNKTRLGVLKRLLARLIS